MAKTGRVHQWRVSGRGKDSDVAVALGDKGKAKRPKQSSGGAGSSRCRLSAVMQREEGKS